MKHEDIRVGMKVDMQKWDADEPYVKRLGICTVVAVIHPAASESGTLVDVRKYNGKVAEGFDANWLTAVDETMNSNQKGGAT